MAPNKADLVAERAASKLAQLQARGLIAAPVEGASTALPTSCQTNIPGVPVLSNAAPSTKQHVRQCVVVPAYCTLEEIATRSGVLALREVPLPLPPLPIVQPRRPASGTVSTGTNADVDSCSLASFDSHIGVYSIDGSRAWLAAADSNCSTPYTGGTAETPSSSLTHCGFDACYPGEQPCPPYLAAGHGAVPPVPPGFEKLVPLAGSVAAALYEDVSDDDMLPLPSRPAILPATVAAAHAAIGAGHQASRPSQQAAGVQFYYQAGSGYHRMGAAASDGPTADAQQQGEQQGQTALSQLQQLYRARHLQQHGLLRTTSLPLPPALAPMPLMFGPTRGTAVTAAIRRGLGSQFERQPELFRQLFGFELHWWAGVRGRPVGEDDLLRVLAFKDYAVVLLRADAYAAPALAPTSLTHSATRSTSVAAAQWHLKERRRRRLALNAPMSALLGQRVCGNAVVIRLWVDFASNHANAASSATSTSSGSSCWVPPEDRILLAPVSCTSLRNELLNAETVAWHLQQSDAIMSEMRLGPERQAGWLLRLPRTPLDMRGDPDTVAALQLAAEAAGLPPMPPGKAAALLAAAAAAARKAVEEDEEEGGAGSKAWGASAVPVPGVPQELAPLLRCVRCTSPWCHPGRRGAALLCPFGHMWRHLDPVAPLMASNQGAYQPSPAVAASMAPPVLNAARPAALQAAAAATPIPGAAAAAGSAPGAPAQAAGPAPGSAASVQALLQPMKALVAEPCESLVSCLSDPDTWCGPLTDLVAAAVEGGMDGAALAAAMAASGPAAEHSAAGSPAAFTSDTAAQADGEAQQESGEADAAKPQDDERGALYAAATATVRPEGWPFYLGFCAQGPQCTRCHSGHELRLATVVQQLKAAAPKKKLAAGPTNRARNMGQVAPSKRAAAVAAAVAAAAAAGKGIATRSGFAALEVEEAPARDTDSDLSDWEQPGEPAREQPTEVAPVADAEDESVAPSGASATASTSYVRAVTAAVAAAEVAAATRSARMAAVAAAAEAAAAAAAAIPAAPPALPPAEAVAAASTAPVSTWSIVSAWYEAATAASAVAPSELPAAPTSPQLPAPTTEDLPAAPAAASADAAPVAEEPRAAPSVQSEASAKRLNPSAAPWTAPLSKCDSQSSDVAIHIEAASRAPSSAVNKSLNPAAQPWTAAAGGEGVQRSGGSSGSMECANSLSSSTSEPAPKSLNPAALPWRAAVSPPQAAAPAAAEPATAPQPVVAAASNCDEEDTPTSVASLAAAPETSLEEGPSKQAGEEEHAVAEALVHAEATQREDPCDSAQSAVEPASVAVPSVPAISTPVSAAVSSAPVLEPSHAPKPVSAPAPAPEAAPAPVPTASGVKSWAAIAAKPPPEPELEDEEWYGDELEQEEAPQPAAPPPISFCGQWAVMRMPGRGLKKAAPAAATSAPAPAPVVEPSETPNGGDAEESKVPSAAPDAAEACHVPPAPSTPPAATGSSGVDAEMSGAASRASAGGATAEVGDSDAFEAVVAAAAAAGKFNWADEAEHEEQEMAAAAAEAEAEEAACRAEQERRGLQTTAGARWQQPESPKRWRKDELPVEVVKTKTQQEVRQEARAQPSAPPPPPQQRLASAATTTTYTSATTATATTTTNSANIRTTTTVQRTGDIPCVSFAAALAAAAAAQRARDGLPAESDDEVEELDEDEEGEEEQDSDEARLRQEEEERRRAQQQVAELQQRWKEQRRAQQEEEEGRAQASRQRQQEEEKKTAEASRQRQAAADSEAVTAFISQAVSAQEAEPASKPAARKSLSDGFEPAPAPDTTSSTTAAATGTHAENASAAHAQAQRSDPVAAEPLYEAPRYQAPPQYAQQAQQQPQFYPQQAVGYMAMPGGGGYVALMAPTPLAPMQMPQMPIAVPLGSGGGSASSCGVGAAGPSQASLQAASAPPSWQLPPQAGWPAGSQVTWVPVIQPPPQQQQGVYGALPAIASMPGAGAYGFMPSVYGATSPMQPTFQSPAYQPGYQPSYVQAQQPQTQRQPLAQTQPYMPHQVAQQPQPKAQLPYFMQPRTDARTGRLKDKLAAATSGSVAASHMPHIQSASAAAAAAGAEDEGDVEDLLNLLVPESR